MSRLTDAIAAERRRLAQREADAVRRLLAYHDTILDALTDDLAAVTEMIETAIRNGEPVNIDWLRRQERYHRLMDDVQAHYRQYALIAQDEAASAQWAGARQGADDAIERVAAMGLTTQVMTARVNVPALERLMGALSPGSPLRQVIDRYGDTAASIIEQELIAGMGRGAGPREVARVIRNRVDGVMMSRSLALTRTELLRAYRGSLFDSYAAMGFQQWQWSAAMSTRTCLACISRSGQVYSMDNPFMPAHVNCFPAGTVVNGPEALAATKRWYVGDMVEIVTEAGEALSVTPNHPILTSRGWVAAGSLHKGDDVIRYRHPEGSAATINPDYEQRPTFIEDVADTLLDNFNGVTGRMPGAAVDFHGDGSDSEVQVVLSDSLLRGASHATPRQPVLQQQFLGRHMGQPLLASLGSFDEGLVTMGTPTHSVIGGGDESLALFDGGLRHTCVQGGGLVPNGDSGLNEPASESRSRQAEFLRERLDRFASNIAFDNFVHWQSGVHDVADRDIGTVDDGADSSPIDAVGTSDLADRLSGLVSTDHIVSVNRRHFSGHVYNLQTSDGWYISNNIITHNCRCSPVPVHPAATARIPSGDEWFARQSADVQRRMIPSEAAYRAYRDGTLTLEDFAGVHHDPVWGASIYQRSGRSALATRGIA